MLNKPINNLIEEQKPKTISEYRRSLRDVIQKICLLGLWRGGFFEYAAFYGGTALRMMYGLDRFSEDLDFSLLEVKHDFKLGDYISSVRNELAAWNISAEVSLSEKPESNVESAFIKANTLKSLIENKVPQGLLSRLHKDEVSRVKFEIDPNPPCPFDYEFRYLLEPIPFSVCTMSQPDLFAGKMHAVLARGWVNRIKGRDWYDLIWFVRNKMPLKLSHLEARLKQSGHLQKSVILSEDKFRQLLRERIISVDFTQAKQDVLSFIPNPASLQNWSKEFFLDLSDLILVQF